VRDRFVRASRRVSCPNKTYLSRVTINNIYYATRYFSFDIETQNFFTDADVGWDNYAALKISVVAVYSYLQGRYFCYEENEMDKLAELFEDARRIVGFSMNRYDIPVLNQYFQKIKGAPKLWEMERVDLLEEIEMSAGQRVSLDRLAELNLGERRRITVRRPSRCIATAK